MSQASKILFKVQYSYNILKTYNILKIHLKTNFAKGGGEGYLTLALQLLCLLHLLYILFEHICKLLFNLCVKQALIQATNLENIPDGPANFKSSLIFIECSFSMSLLLIMI